jgi:hypothetical protein
VKLGYTGFGSKYTPSNAGNKGKEKAMICPAGSSVWVLRSALLSLILCPGKVIFCKGREVAREAHEKRLAANENRLTLTVAIP